MRRVLRLGRRLLYSALDGLAVFGAMSGMVPPGGDWQGSWTARLSAAPRRLRGPGAGHPESMCLEVPLSEAELRLAGQLDDLAALWPTAGRGSDSR